MCRIEVLFSVFVNSNIKNVKYIDKIGMEGYVCLWFILEKLISSSI